MRHIGPNRAPPLARVVDHWPGEFYRCYRVELAGAGLGRGLPGEPAEPARHPQRTLSRLWLGLLLLLLAGAGVLYWQWSSGRLSAETIAKRLSNLAGIDTEIPETQRRRRRRRGGDAETEGDDLSFWLAQLPDRQFASFGLDAAAQVAPVAAEADAV